MDINEMTDDELTKLLVESVGGRFYRGLCGDDDCFTIDSHYVSPRHLRELIHDDIFPVIRERGKWDRFIRAVKSAAKESINLSSVKFLKSTGFDAVGYYDEIIKAVLTLPARTLAEKCLEVLREGGQVSVTENHEKTKLPCGCPENTPIHKLHVADFDFYLIPPDQHRAGARSPGVLFLQCGNCMRLIGAQRTMPEQAEQPRIIIPGRN